MTSMWGSIILWVPIIFSLILNSSLSSLTYKSIKNLAFTKWLELELGSSANWLALFFKPSSILVSLSFISLVKFEVSHSFVNKETTLFTTPNISMRMDDSTWSMVIFLVTFSKKKISNYLSILCRMFSWPFKSLLNFHKISINLSMIGILLFTSIWITINLIMVLTIECQHT